MSDSDFSISESFNRKSTPVPVAKPRSFSGRGAGAEPF